MPFASLAFIIDLPSERKSKYTLLGTSGIVMKICKQQCSFLPLFVVSYLLRSKVINTIFFISKKIRHKMGFLLNL